MTGQTSLGAKIYCRTETTIHSNGPVPGFEVSILPPDSIRAVFLSLLIVLSAVTAVHVPGTANAAAEGSKYTVDVAVEAETFDVNNNDHDFVDGDIRIGEWKSKGKGTDKGTGISGEVKDQSAVPPSIDSRIENEVSECGSFQSGVSDEYGAGTHCIEELDSAPTFDTGNGDITVVVKEGLDLSGGSHMDIEGDGSVTIMVRDDDAGSKIGGSMELGDKNNPSELRVYLHSGVGTLSIKGGGAADDNVNGLIYAPDSTVEVKGGAEIEGSVVAKTFSISGGGNPSDYNVVYSTGMDGITVKTDATAPSFAKGYPTTANPTTNGFDIDVKADEGGTAYYVVVSNGATAPSKGRVKNGENADGNEAAASGEASIGANEEKTFTASGLDPDTEYDVYVVVEDGAGNGRQSSKVDAKTAAGDTTAPSVSGVSLGNDGSDDLKLSFQSDEQLSAITVTVDGPSNADVYTFDEGDFSESSSGGTYTYTLSTTQAYDDGDGTYTATVDDAKDSAGNNGGENGKGSGLSDDYTFTTEPSISYSGLSVSPSSIHAGSSVDASATVENTGNADGTFNASLKVNGTVRRWRNGTLEAGDSTTVSFTETLESPGPKQVTIKTLSAQTVTVENAWFQAGYDLGRTGHDPEGVGPKPPLVEEWRITIDAVVRSSIVVVDGIVYAASRTASQDSIYAIDPNGTVIWTKNVGEVEHASMTVVDGTLYAGTRNGEILYALNASTGAERWSVSTDGPASGAPTVVDGVLYHADGDGYGTVDNVWARYATNGSVIWQTTVPQFKYSDPTVANGLVFLLTSHDEHVYALDAQTGSTVWTFDAGTRLESTPVVDGNTVYVGAGGTVFALNTSTASMSDTERKRWSTSIGSSASTPAIRNDTVYVGSDSGLHALNAASGSERWTVSTDDRGRRPVIADDVVYVPTDAGTVYTVNASSGTELGSVTAAGAAITAESAVFNGTLYVGSDDKNIYALGEDTTAPSIAESNFTATNPQDRDIDITFTSSEQLTTIEVTINGSGGTTVTTLTTGDFAETDNGDGTYTYTNVSTVASGGTYTGNLTRAEDAAGNDGASGQNDTVTVSSTPELSTSAGTTDYTVGGSAVTVDPSLTAHDDEGDTVDGARVVIQNKQPGDTLSFTPRHGITGSYDSSKGVLELTGTATPSKYQDVFRSVTFSNTKADPDTTGRTITFSLGTKVPYDGNDHFYEYKGASGGITWPNANSSANGKTYFGLQGYLVTITSSGENDFVENKLQGDGWMGASDDTSFGYISEDPNGNDRWYWVTGPEQGTHFWTGDEEDGFACDADGCGDPVSGQFSKWYDGEPNDHDGIDGNENYAHFYHDRDGRWNDFPGDNTVAGYVVEYGGMPGDPEITWRDNKTVTVTKVTAPTIDSASLASDNGYVEITFSEGVYTNSDGSGGVTTADFKDVFSPKGGSATGISITDVTDTNGNDPSGGETKTRVHIGVEDGPASGVEEIEIKPSNGNTIFDADGTAMSGGQTTGTITLNDRSGPSVSSASLAEKGTGDGVVKEGDTVTISAKVTDSNGINSVTADASAFGAGSSVALSDPGNDGVYEASIEVGSSGTPNEGDRTVTITATDENDNSNSADTDSLEIDTTEPSITGVTEPTDREYNTGERLTFEVNYDETVEVSGTPSIDLNIGGTTKQAKLTKGKGTATLTFEYTIRQGDSDDDGIEYASTTISGGTLEDAAGHSAERFFGDKASLSGVTVNTDTVPPSNPVSTSGGSIVESNDDGYSVDVELVDGHESGTVTVRLTGPNGKEVTEAVDAGADTKDGTTDTVTVAGIDAASLADGSVTIEAKITDGAGNENGAGFTAGSTVTKDTKPPADPVSTSGAPITSSNEGDYSVDVELVDGHESGTATVRLTGPNGKEVTEAVDAGADAKDGTTDTVTVAGIDAASLADGSTTVEAKVEDDIGHGNAHGFTAESTVTKDTAAPSIDSTALTDDTDGSGVVAAGDSITITATVTESNAVTVEADASAFDAGNSVELTDNDGDDTYETTVTVGSSPSEGSQSVTVTATDSAGNGNAATAGPLTVDTTGPGTAPSGVAATAVAGGDIEVSFDDVDDGTDTYSVRRSTASGSGYAEVGTIPDDDGQSYAFTDTGTTGGTTYYYVVVPVDRSGNEGTQSSEASATADATAPTVTAFGVANPTGQTTTVAVEVDEQLSALTVSGTDDASGAVLSGIGNSGDFTESRGGTGYTYTATLSAGSDGTFGATLDTAEDAAGNDGAGGQTDSATVDTVPPTVSDFTATNPSGQNIRVSLDSSEPLATISVAIGGAGSAALTRSDFTETVSGTTRTYTATYSGDSDGTYTATLNAAGDGSGNDGADGQSDAVAVDTTPPTISSFTVSNPSGRDVQIAFVSDEQLAAVEVAVSGAESATLTGSDFTETGNEDGTYTYAVTYPGSSDGTYTATLNTAEDAAGNDGASGRSNGVTIDTTAPAISAFSASTLPSIGTDVRVTFDADEQLNAIDVGISGADSATLTASDFTESGSGPYTYTATYTGSSGGTYTATLTTAEDAAGNDGADGQQDSATIDTDTDGDGILDSTEGTVDTDGDGTPDYKDTDADGDGIPDSKEGTGDTDGDGTPDYKDTDADGGGIPDGIEGTADVDGDGILNYRDTDSDGDGTTDATEGTGDSDDDDVPNYLDPVDDDSDVIARPSASSYLTSVGTGVELTGSDSKVPADASPTYEWDFDGDGTADGTGETVRHTFPAPGTHSVRLTVSAGGITSEGTVTITVEDRTSPSVDAGDDRVVDEGDTASFDVSGPKSSDNVGITGYEWDFDGDGTIDATGATPSHTYDDPGTYTVTVTASDAAGNTVTNSTIVEVNGPEAVVGTSSLKFGNTATGSSDVTAVRITNDGSSPLDLTGSSFGGSDASQFALAGGAASSLPTIQPGETGSVAVAFSPTGTGDKTATLTLSTNDSDNPSASISLSGSGVTSDLSADKSMVDFGDVAIDNAASTSITLENGGSASVDVTAIGVNGSDADQFEIADDGGLPAAIGGGGSRSVTVEYAPTGTGGHTATLEVDTANGREIVVSLIGTGLGPDIAFPDGGATFTEVGKGRTKTKTVTLSNYGSRPLDINASDVEPIGADADQFSVSGVPSTVAAGGSETVNVTFSPGSAGSFSAKLQVTSDDPDEGTATIPVNGTAVAANIGVDNRTLDFGNVTKGETVTMNITVRNLVSSKADLNVQRTYLTGRDPGAFEVTHGKAPFTLAPGQTKRIELAFTPLTAGTKEAQLQIVSDAGNNPQIDVWLSNTRTYIVVQEVGEGSSGDEQGPKVNIDANRIDRGSNLTVNVSRPATRQENASIDTLNMTVEPGGYFDMNVTLANQPGDPSVPAFSANGTQTLQYVQLTHTLADSGFSGTGFVLRVNKSAVPDGVSASEITLRRFSSGQWNVLSATLLETSARYYFYSIDTPGFSEFTITAPTPDSGSQGAGGGDPSVATSIKASPSEVSFGEVTAGTSTNRTVEITNNGFTGTDIRSVAIGGPDASAFEVTTDDVPYLPPGRSEPLRIEFAPTDDGSAEATLTVETDDGTTTEIALTGIGRSDVRVSNRSLFFGNVTVGESVRRCVVVSVPEDAGGSVNVTGTDLIGGDIDDFAITDNSAPFALAPGESRCVEVTLTPTSPGQKFATLRLLWDATASSRLDVALSNLRTLLLVRPLGETQVNVEGIRIPRGTDIDVNTSTPRTIDGDVYVNNLEFTVLRDGNFTMNITHSDGPPTASSPEFDGGNDRVALKYIDLAHSIPNAQLEDTAIRFRVDKDRLRPLGATPDEVVFHRYSGGQWNRMRTDLVDETSDEYVYRSPTPGFSTFVVSSPSYGLRVVDSDLDPDEVRIGESVKVSARIGNFKGSAGSMTVTLSQDGRSLASKSVTVGGNQTGTVQFAPSFDTPGTYTISINGRTVGDVTVLDATTANTTPSTPAPGGEEQVTVTDTDTPEKGEITETVAPETGDDTGEGRVDEGGPSDDETGRETAAEIRAESVTDSGGTVLWVFVVVVLALAGLFLLFFLWKRRKDEEEEEEEEEQEEPEEQEG